MGKVSTT